jgi:hypothetical protein
VDSLAGPFMEISILGRCQNIFKTLFSKISFFGITIFGIKSGLMGHLDMDLNMFWGLAHTGKIHCHSHIPIQFNNLAVAMKFSIQ